MSYHVNGEKKNLAKILKTILLSLAWAVAGPRGRSLEYSVERKYHVIIISQLMLLSLYSWACCGWEWECIFGLFYLYLFISLLFYCIFYFFCLLLFNEVAKTCL